MVAIPGLELRTKPPEAHRDLAWFARPLHRTDMDASDLERTLEFLRAAEQLKNVTRRAYTSDGHQESVAEHTWRLCLMALVFQDSFLEMDMAKLLKICIIHDLGEAIGGDIPAPQQDSVPGKAAQEREDLLQLVAPLPQGIRMEIVALWDEYEAASSAEAKLAKALDKLETILQHNQGQNPGTFDYRFNLEYGASYTTAPPIVASIRAILDRETEQRAREAEQVRELHPPDSRRDGAGTGPPTLPVMSDE